LMYILADVCIGLEGSCLRFFWEAFTRSQSFCFFRLCSNNRRKARKRQTYTSRIDTHSQSNRKCQKGEVKSEKPLYYYLLYIYEVSSTNHSQSVEVDRVTVSQSVRTGVRLHLLTLSVFVTSSSSWLTVNAKTCIGKHEMRRC
jgi:hypothetical protein